MSEHDPKGVPSGHERRLPTHGGDAPDDGVDVTLIRWFLSLTPSERLDALKRNVDALIELRRGGR